MGCTKSNKAPKVGEKKNAFVELVDLWKQDVNWKSNAKNNQSIMAMPIPLALSLVIIELKNAIATNTVVIKKPTNNIITPTSDGA